MGFTPCTSRTCALLLHALLSWVDPSVDPGFPPSLGRHTPNSNLVMECEGKLSVDAFLSQQNKTQCRIDFWNVLWGSWPWTLVLSHSLQLLL